jgi:hypothetical protein
MKILCAAVFGALGAGILVGAGCADTHLGDGFGRRAHSALEAQAQARGVGDSAGSLDSDDAKITLARQRGRAIPGAPGATPVGMAPVVGGFSYGGTSLSGSGQSSTTTAGIPSSTANAPIRLDAVR